MNKKSLISFASLFAFWLVISGSFNLQHIVVGALLSSFTVWFWKDFKPKLPSILYPVELLLFLRCIIMLIGYVIKSNINVIRILLFSNLSSGSLFLELEPGIKSDWGRVFLATCITITPGTITIDYDPEHDVFTVHALNLETAVDLYHWSIITEIRELERIVQRRKDNAINNGRIHDSDSIGPSKGDHWTDRH